LLSLIVAFGVSMVTNKQHLTILCHSSMYFFLNKIIIVCQFSPCPMLHTLHKGQQYQIWLIILKVQQQVMLPTPKLIRKKYMYSQRHSVINHSDICISHLCDTGICSWLWVFLVKFIPEMCVIIQPERATHGSLYL
jgi:hypothetical protein